MTYDRYQFIDNIDSIQGVKFIRTDVHDGIRANVYEGITGHIAVLETTDLDEDVTFIEGVGILVKLGLNYLIPVFFPPPNEVTNQEQPEEMIIISEKGDY